MSSKAHDRIGSFTLLRRLGAGGMGEVYEAYQPSLQRAVAIKVLPSWLAEDPDEVERFRREAAIAAQLDHPHILPVYDFGQEGPRCYIVMKLVRGMTLQELIRRRQRVFQAMGSVPAIPSAKTVDARAALPALELAAWFKKGSGTVVRSTLRAVPATVPDPFLNHAELAEVLDAMMTPAPQLPDPSDIRGMRGVCEEFCCDVADDQLPQGRDAALSESRTGPIVAARRPHRHLFPGGHVVRTRHPPVRVCSQRTGTGREDPTGRLGTYTRAMS